MYYFLGRPNEARVIQRPKDFLPKCIQWIFFIVSLGIQTGTLFFLVIYRQSLATLMWCILMGCILWGLVFLKRILILSIHCYQQYAPKHVRCRCMMMPSCSEYGLMSLNRHGLVIGIISTWKRLRKRCVGCYLVDFP